MLSQIKYNGKSTTTLDIGSSLTRNRTWYTLVLELRETQKKEYFQIAQIVGNDPGNQVIQEQYSRCVKSFSYLISFSKSPFVFPLYEIDCNSYYTHKM